MGRKRDKAGGRPLRLTAYAASAALGYALLAVPSFAQSGSSNTGSATADPYANTGADNVAKRTAAAKTTATDAADEAPLNTPLRFYGETTGSILDEDIRRVNLRETGVDGLRGRQDPDRAEAEGIRLGSFTLKPSINQSYNAENNRTGSDRDDRTFLQTDLRSTLTSDWSRHALTIIGDGVWQQNVSGSGEEQPTVNLDADLRLDLPADTTAHLTAGYRFYREDTDDPNAIAGAQKQSGVNEFDAGASLERDFGLLRGSTAVGLVRTIYSDAVLSDGTTVTLSDRDQTAGTWRGRIGYEMSPALIPFVEVDLGRVLYDEDHDSAGYARSNHAYGGKVGVEFDLGEKLRGELGIGYQHTDFEDWRLASIDSPTVDGNIFWSPHRGTNVDIGFSTSVEPSTTPGESGYVAYQLTTTLSQEVRENLLAKVTGGTTWRDYATTSLYGDETVYDAALGFTWGINRYLDLTGNVGYELTKRDGADDSHQLRAGVGLTARR
ncbi:outer membrane beta-barrel protein [Rhizobium sp. RAF56]|jgi:hypothetical protein|uniref:outer membrane beta-barrel protein n=1 Tax=Rhizobium sp. RAF56 TaxID=3233062 RepID=UPI003F9EA925